MNSVFITLVLCFSGYVCCTAINATSPGQTRDLIEDTLNPVSPLLQPVIGLLNLLTYPFGGLNGVVYGLNYLTGGAVSDLLSPYAQVLYPLGIQLRPFYGGLTSRDGKVTRDGGGLVGSLVSILSGLLGGVVGGLGGGLLGGIGGGGNVGNLFGLGNLLNGLTG